MTHTPGPWHLTPDASAIYTNDAIGYRAETITRLPSSGRKANARLIAAAPELLEALENCLNRLLNDDENSPPDIGQMQAAINKAKGA